MVILNSTGLSVVCQDLVFIVADNEVYPICSSVLSLLVSPLLSVISAFIVYTKVGSVASGILLSGIAVNLITNEPSGFVSIFP